MGKLRKIATAVLACLLMLTGCAVKGENTDTGADVQDMSQREGRYVETDVTPEGEHLVALEQQEDGTLLAFTEGLKAVYTSNDSGKTWSKKELVGGDDERLANVRSVSVMTDGNYLVHAAGVDVNANDELLKISPEGEILPFSVPKLEELKKENTIYLAQVTALPENRFYMEYMTGGQMMTSTEDEEGGGFIEGSGEATEAPEGESADGGGMNFTTATSNEDGSAIYDGETGEQLQKIVDSMGAMDIAVSGDSMYVADYNDGIIIRNAADGKETSKVTSKQAQEQSKMVMGFSLSSISVLNGEIYVLGTDGLFKKDKSTGGSTKMMGTEMYQLGSTSNYVNSFIMLENDTFLALVESDGDSQLLRYEFDSSIKISEENTLRVWALENNSTIRAMISQFCAANPDKGIELEIALSSEGAQTADDAIRNLNTRILAGDGPDVMFLDGCPLNSYAKQGLLLPLSEKVSTDGLYDSLIEQVKIDGELYYVPTKYRVPLLLSSEEYQSKMQTLSQLVDEVLAGNDQPELDFSSGDPFANLPADERPVFTFDDFDELFGLLWNTSASEIIKDNKIDEEKLKELAEALKQISDKYQLLKETNGMAAAVAMMISAGGEGEVLAGSTMAYTNNRATVGALVSGSPTVLRSSGNESTKYGVLPGLSEGAWVPINIAGISAKSEKQELAYEFVNSMLSDESQSAPAMGFAVNKNAAKVQWQEAQEMELSTIDGKETFSYDFQLNFDELVSKLKTPVFEDKNIENVIKSNLEKYSKGETELEEMIKSVQDETKIYLAERI